VVFAAGLVFTAEASLLGVLLVGPTTGDPCKELLLCRSTASCGRWFVAAVAAAIREVSSFVASEPLDEDFLNPNVVSFMDGKTLEMALARGMEANRTSHKPQITLAKTMRIV
jgi:hypothetical protein